MRVRDALAEARTALTRAGIEAAALESQILLEEASGLTRVEVLREPDRELDDALRGAEAPAFGVVVSNPPYVATAEWTALPREVREHEPRVALDGGPDGLAFLRRIVREAPRVLAPRGALALEIGETQGDAVAQMIHADNTYSAVAIHADLAGRPRIVTAEMR